jgi:ATP-binding cassette, subfamily B, bacterial PglK
LDLIGIGLIGPFVALIIDPERFGRGRLENIISSVGLSFPGDHFIRIVGISLLTVFFIKMVVGIYVNKTILGFSRKQENRLRSMLMEAYQNLPFEAYLGRNSSQYVYSIISLTSHFSSGVIVPALRTLSDGIVAIAILAMLAWSNPIALAALLFLLSSLILSYDRIFRRKAKLSGIKSNEAAIRVVQGVTEAMSGFKEIRVFGVERYFRELVNRNSEKQSYYGLMKLFIGLLPRYLMEFTLVLFIISFVLVALTFRDNLETLIPTLSMFGIAALRLVPAANTFSKSLVELRVNRDSINRIYTDLKWVREDKVAKSGPMVASERLQKFCDLSLQGVFFRYSGARVMALNGVSLKISSGEAIGFFGTSGSGKTTLIDIILGLLSPKDGEIRYNGLPLEETLENWRGHVAYLPQDICLLDDSLCHNVAFGQQGDKIDRIKVGIAIKQARLSTLVEEWPEGLDTRLGEHGVRLSGGQKQRVALARAFYHDRDVLILDEATSALDKITESEIVDEIQRLKGQRTVIVIAHRLDTLKYCDRVYRLENGCIVAEGEYEKLIRGKSGEN